MSCEKVNDPVNHPSHYTAGNIEVIDFLEDQKFPYHLGNAVKYICRAGKKDPNKTIEDLQKAVWYLNRYIGLIDKETGKAVDTSHDDDIASALISAERGGARLEAMHDVNV